ncbi:TIGR01244 family sulfur transferase [Parvularcula lutaonensis]|uniref:TIGR01244 family sulfur transferase n=1 Tax=Parvularcula lutaonensis TaxID=491923 RepID=A0ABV7M8G2_9PROT|nr:TIGR01244 family sulfur transferase [Parvularcula lutaonensis]GGY42751.1 hypothetical protein GCM10007148_09280 [Parvularcula lutaonensis]
MRRLNEKVSVSGQISPEDLPKLKAAGFDVVVDGRPDQEIPAEAGSAVMAEKAAEAGLSFHYVPITPGSLPSEEHVAAFQKALGEGRVFAYCGGGPRVIALASFAAAAEGRLVDEIIEEARTAGIDLSQARLLLIERGARES